METPLYFIHHFVVSELSWRSNQNDIAMPKHYFTLRASSGDWSVQIDPVYQEGTCSQVSQNFNFKLFFKDKVLVSMSEDMELPVEAQVCIKICGFSVGVFDRRLSLYDESSFVYAHSQLKEINTLPFPFPFPHS